MSLCHPFALYSSAGQNASIHPLPKGAPSFDKSDNNTLAPTTKVCLALFIKVTSINIAMASKHYQIDPFFLV